jgi:hypothetical protein
MDLDSNVRPSELEIIKLAAQQRFSKVDEAGLPSLLTL